MSDPPHCQQLTMLAKETSVQTGLLVARQELQALLKQIKQVEVPSPVVPLKSQPVEALADCENAAELIEPPAAQDEDCYVLNRTTRGNFIGLGTTHSGANIICGTHTASGILRAAAQPTTRF